MNASSTVLPHSGPNPLRRDAVEGLLELIRRAREAQSPEAARFIAANDTHLIAPYQQAALWYFAHGTTTLSGVTDIDANAPYVQWLNTFLLSLPPKGPMVLKEDELASDVRTTWNRWLPPRAVWLPFGAGDGRGGLLLARELPWSETEEAVLAEWIPTWHCAYRALDRRGGSTPLLRRVRQWIGGGAKRPFALAAAFLAVCALPVRMSVLAPGELVPAHPVAIRAPMDGVIKAFQVETNATVQEGDVVFVYEDAILSSRLALAREALHAAELEYRQVAQGALSDPKARAALPMARGAVEEKQVELEYLRGQVGRAEVRAPRSGIAFVDDASAWVGRSVTAGERILRLAEPADCEVEAWIAVGDAIALDQRSDVKLYLSASPFSPVSARLRTVGYEPVRRPDGTYAYRVRATLLQATAHRVGLKGTARLSTGRVPLAYWMLRRPLAAARGYLGI